MTLSNYYGDSWYDGIHGPCVDNDNGDGAVTDQGKDLMWQQSDDGNVYTAYYTDAARDVFFEDAPFQASLSCAIDSGTPPCTFTWDFGDSTPGSTEQSPSHFRACNLYKRFFFL